MSVLKPLEEFICDTCGDVINTPREGWVEWIRERGGRMSHSFRICHHASVSPFSGKEGCYRHGDESGCADEHLHTFLEFVHIKILSFVDVGPYHDIEFSGPHVRDLREWTEFARRITIPYYDQARNFWGRAQSEGYFDGGNETSVYSEAFLLEMIEEFMNGDE